MSAIISQGELTEVERAKVVSMVRHIAEEERLEIVASTNLRKDLGLDSMDAFRLLGAIEIEFEINIGWKLIADVRSVGDIYELIVKQRDTRNGATKADGV